MYISYLNYLDKIKNNWGIFKGGEGEKVDPTPSSKRVT